MAEYSREDIINLIDEEDIEFIRLQFTDIAGNLKNMAMTVNQIGRILDGRCKFDCAAVDGFRGMGYEELFLVPDLDTFVIFPWRPQNGKVARFICDVVKPDGTPFDGDSRYILKRAISQAKEMGYQLDVAVKNEFFLFDLGENGEPTNHTSEKGGYFDIGPIDGGENARRDMVLFLADMGIEVESSYHSEGAAQHVLDLKHVNALKMADDIMTTRLVVRTAARRHGVHATFMPKPKENVQGSGAHYTYSLCNKYGKNIFTDKGDKLGVSEEGYQFMAGILNHIASMSLVNNPIVNSYKRLIPGYLAPVSVCWSSTNRSPLIRLTSIGGDGARVVLRSPDGASNPYLVIAACLCAGLDGIKQTLKPPACMDEIAAEIEVPEKLPRTLHEAVSQFKKDAFLQEALGGHISNHLIQTKDREWNEYCKQVTEWEKERYLGTV